MVAVQVRDVPDSVRDDLARAAQRRGVSLQVFLLGVLEREASASRNLELMADWKPVRGRVSRAEADAAELVRRERAAREEHLMDVVTRRP